MKDLLALCVFCFDPVVTGDEYCQYEYVKENCLPFHTKIASKIENSFRNSKVFFGVFLLLKILKH